MGDWDHFFANLRGAYHPCVDPVVRGSALDWNGQPRCGQSKPGSRIDVVVFGDSHAEHLFVGLADALPDENVLYSVPGPLPGGRLASDEMKLMVDYTAAQPSIKTVIVNLGWAKRGAQADDLLDILAALTAVGKAVFVTDDIPRFEFDAIDCKYRLAPVLPFARCSEARPVFDEQYARYFDSLRDTVAAVPGAHLLNTAQYFCDEHFCSMNVGDEMFYRDRNHLNESGSRFLVDRMLADYPHFRAAVD